MESGNVETPLWPWAVSEAEYSVSGSVEERIRFLPRYAILAPSGHNTQPWLFRIRDRAVELRADRTRALAVVDPEDRTLVISCGAALATLRVAARHFGLRAAVEALPDPSGEDSLSLVSLDPGDPPSDDEEELFRAIQKRHSNRQAFEAPTTWRAAGRGGRRSTRTAPPRLTQRLVRDWRADPGLLPAPILEKREGHAPAAREEICRRRPDAGSHERLGSLEPRHPDLELLERSRLDRDPAVGRLCRDDHDVASGDDESLVANREGCRPRLDEHLRVAVKMWRRAPPRSYLVRKCNP